jgi:hypothetical protein
MLNWLDKFYVNVRDRLTRSAVERGYNEGHRDGQRKMKAAIMTNLYEKAPLDFKSLELKLGFVYAEGIAKDTKLC